VLTVVVFLYDKEIIITMMNFNFELTDDQAYALAQFVKRCGWTEWRQNAVDDAEAYLMRDAFDQLAAALKDGGYSPR
jgi:hypothetical protein